MIRTRSGARLFAGEFAIAGQGVRIAVRVEEVIRELGAGKGPLVLKAPAVIAHHEDAHWRLFFDAVVQIAEVAIVESEMDPVEIDRAVPGSHARIVRTDRVELRAQVPAADAATARGVAELALEIPGRPDPVSLKPEHMHDAGVIDGKTGALPVQFQVANPGGQLLVGQHATAVLYRRDRSRVPAVNKQAVLTEAGRPYVWVQSGGEAFVRRYIEIATRDGDWVGVKSGLKPGDRVVIRGAYEVQLAAAAKGLPAEGHVH